MENLLLGLVTPLSGLSFLSSLFTTAIPSGEYTHATFLKDDDDESDDDSDDDKDSDDSDDNDDSEESEEDSDDDSEAPAEAGGSVDI